MPVRHATQRQAPQPVLTRLESEGDFGTGATTYLALAGEQSTIYAEDEIGPGALSPSSAASGSLGNPASPPWIATSPDYMITSSPSRGPSEPHNTYKPLSRLLMPQLTAIMEDKESSRKSSMVSLQPIAQDVQFRSIEEAEQYRLSTSNVKAPPPYSQVFSAPLMTRASSEHSSIGMMQADLHDMLNGKQTRNPLYCSRATSFRSAAIASPTKSMMSAQLSNASILTSDT